MGTSLDDLQLGPSTSPLAAQATLPAPSDQFNQLNSQSDYTNYSGAHTLTINQSINWDSPAPQAIETHASAIGFPGSKKCLDSYHFLHTYVVVSCL